MTPLPGTLYLVSTPIGNLKDITLRAIEVLKNVDFVASEDTRQTIKLLTHYGIPTPRISYHDHSSRAKLESLIEKLKEGKNIALVSDSGTPLVSDPGFPLVREAIRAGIRIEPIPGPNALLSALVVSGLPCEKFVFLGYLPYKSVKRRKQIELLKEEEKTTVVYESPHRILKALKDIEDILPDRQIALCRELTKKFEEVIRGNASKLIAEISQRKKLGEIVLVIEGK